MKLIKIPLICDDMSCRDELGDFNVIGYWEVSPDREHYYKEIRKHSVFYCSYHYNQKVKKAKENKKQAPITYTP